MFSYKNLVTSIVSKLNKSNELFFFWSTLFFYFFSIFNLNNKTLFISLLLLWFIYYKRTKDIRNSLIATAIASLIFVVGKSWIRQLITPEFMRSSDYPRGYLSVITITPFQILSSFIGIIILRDLIISNKFKIKLKNTFFNKKVFLILLFFIWQLVSSLLAKNIYNLSLILSLQAFAFFVFYLGLLLFGRGLINIYIFQLGAMAVFEAFLSLIQWLKGSTLGLVIESSSQILSYYKGADQNFFSVRAMGTFSHPNELGIFSLLLIPLFFSYLYFKNFKHYHLKIYHLIFLLSSILTLLLSQSRSSWISLSLAILFFTYYAEKKWKIFLLNLSDCKLNIKNFIYAIILLTIASILIIPRTLKMAYLLVPKSGGESRIFLIKESLDLITNYPFFGTGIGLSGLAMFKLKPEGIVSTLPATVHNLYLLLASESGLPSLLIFIIFVLVIFKYSLTKFNYLPRNDKIKLLGILSGIFGVLVNGLMQQIFFWGYFLLLIFLTNNEKFKN